MGPESLDAPWLFELAFYHVDKLLLRIYVELGIDLFDMAFHGIARNDVVLHDEASVTTLGGHSEILALARRRGILFFWSFAALVDRFGRIASWRRFGWLVY